MQDTGTGRELSKHEKITFRVSITASPSSPKHCRSADERGELWIEREYQYNTFKCYFSLEASANLRTEEGRECRCITLHLFALQKPFTVSSPPSSLLISYLIFGKVEREKMPSAQDKNKLVHVCLLSFWGEIAAFVLDWGPTWRKMNTKVLGTVGGVMFMGKMGSCDYKVHGYHLKIATHDIGLCLKYWISLYCFTDCTHQSTMI